jgi:glycerol 2-dehydrogenase (NADP+)
MEDLHRSGRVKAIGVANWSVSFLEELRRTWKIVPAVNQVELHPYLPQHELKKYCEDLGILLEAYSPLGSTGKHNESTSGLRVYWHLAGAPLMSDEDIQRIANKHGVSAATVLISYHVCKGVVAIPKSVSGKRISANRQTIQLPEEDIAQLDGVAAKGKAKRINTPLWGSDLGFPDWYEPVSIK